MVFKKKRHRRRTMRDGGRRRSRSRSYRRHKDRRIPIIATAGAVGSFFVPRPGGFMSFGQWILNTVQGKEPNLMSTNTLSGNGVVDAVGDLMAQYVGYDFRSGSWGIPMATVVAVGSGLASKVVTKIAGNPLAKIPYVGRYLKF